MRDTVQRCKGGNVQTWRREPVDARGSGNVQIATGSLCKGAKVIKQVSGVGCREGEEAVRTCKSAKVETWGQEGGQWKRGRGDKRYSAKVQMCKGGGKKRPDCRLFGVEFEPAGEGLAVL